MPLTALADLGKKKGELVLQQVKLNHLMRQSFSLSISKSVLILVILSNSGFKGFDLSGCSNPVQWGVRNITRLNSHVAKQHV